MRIILALILVVAVAGCAKPDMDSRWQAYYETKQLQATEPQQKQFDIAVDADGKFKGVTIYAIAAPVSVERPTEQFHPAWTIAGNVINAAIPYVGFVTGAKVIGDSLADIVKAGNNPVSYSNSFNTAGGDYSGGDMDSLVTSSADSDSSLTVGGDYAGSDAAYDSSVNTDTSNVTTSTTTDTATTTTTTTDTTTTDTTTTDTTTTDTTNYEPQAQ